MRRICSTKLSVCILVGLAAGTLLLAGCKGSPSDADISYLDDEGFRKSVAAVQPGTLIIDARSPDAYAAGTIPGAVNVQLRDVPVQDVKARFSGYKRIIVFGPHPGSPRAAALSKRLLAGGVSVETYLPGYERWQELQESPPQPDSLDSPDAADAPDAP